MSDAGWKVARLAEIREAVDLGRGELLYARPGVHREAVALETPTIVFMVGGRPGHAYSRPIWAFDWREQSG